MPDQQYRHRTPHPSPDNPGCHAVATSTGVHMDCHDAQIRADERAKVAQEIRAHADRYAPGGHPPGHPRTVLRRHLLLAARIATGPLTDDDLAHIAAQIADLARQHAAMEPCRYGQGDPS